MSDETIWGKKEYVGPSAGLVKRHYVEARLDALHRRNKDLEKQIAEKLKGCTKLQGMKLSGDKWLAVYKKVTQQLQAADLTINFDAKSWFSNENTYESYTQLYERSGKSAGGNAQLLSNPQNPARMRADVDDKITFKNQVATGARPAVPQRGLMPGRQGMDRVREQMEFRAGAADRRVPTDKTDPNKDKVYADSTNKHFNPKTKQVFAALNYGRRLHGSNFDYGTSHLVLADRFKVNALYYGGDTFYHQDSSKQTAYHVLGALIAFVDDKLLDAILDSCYFGSRLQDTKHATMMVEAHLFDELTFKGNIKEIVLEATFGSSQHANAKKFASKHGAKITLVGP